MMMVSEIHSLGTMTVENVMAIQPVVAQMSSWTKFLDQCTDTVTPRATSLAKNNALDNRKIESCNLIKY